MTITSLSSTPTAGTRVTLTCTVISDQPSQITWNGPSGPILTSRIDLSITQDSIHERVFDYNDTLPSTTTPRSSRIVTYVRSVSNITFHSLRVSNGAVYTCNSMVNVTSTRKNAQETYSLQVQSM